MDLTMSEAERALRAEVRAVLDEPDVREALDAVLASTEPEPDIRPLYRELGRRSLLAVGWPVEYGGRGATHTEAAAVLEELVLAGVPDMVHVLSVQIVGLFLLQAGTPEQKAEHLPAIASGEQFATVLYTEPEVGSDLASLATRATAEAGGHRISGLKVYGLKSAISDLALCAARTSVGTNRYDGISLFLLPLTAEGVTRGTLPSIADDQFDRVKFDGVLAGPETLLGTEGQGWSLLTECLALERVGLDYSLKAARWFEAATRDVDPTGADDTLLAEIGRHGAAVEAGRLLSRDVIGQLDRGRVDPVAAAMAKFHTSETAQKVASWAAFDGGLGGDDADSGVLESAYREGPGLTLSAGTSQIMLELVATSALDTSEGA